MILGGAILTILYMCNTKLTQNPFQNKNLFQCQTKKDDRTSLQHKEGFEEDYELGWKERLKGDKLFRWKLFSFPSPHQELMS